MIDRHDEGLAKHSSGNVALPRGYASRDMARKARPHDALPGARRLFCVYRQYPWPLIQTAATINMVFQRQALDCRFLTDHDKFDLIDFL